MGTTPEKLCDKCGEKMTGELISQMGSYITIKYTCTRKNCVRNKFPSTDRQSQK